MLYDVDELKKSIVEIDRQLYQRHLTSGGGGGPSVRVPCYNYDGSKILTNVVLMKGWAPRIGLEWVPSHGYVATTDLDGNIIGPVRPLKEADIHLRIYRAREDVGAVIHAHPPYLISYMMARARCKERPGPFFDLLTDAPLTAEAPAGSAELAKNVSEAFEGNRRRLVFMENHGVTVVGSDLYHAYFTLDHAEDLAKIFFFSRMGLA